MTDLPSDADRGTRAVLNALRAYRASEAAMRRSRGLVLKISENDFLALRFILANDDAGRVTLAKDVAHYLGISSASTTTLIGRLVQGGYVQKRASTSDRRAVEIVPLRPDEPSIRDAVGDTNELVVQAAAELNPEELRTVTSFLNRLQSAIDGIDEQSP
ncbi:MAG: MarR family transcriptional regulator [Leifsonia sp.]